MTSSAVCTTPAPDQVLLRAPGVDRRSLHALSSRWVFSPRLAPNSFGAFVPVDGAPTDTGAPFRPIWRKSIKRGTEAVRALLGLPNETSAVRPLGIGRRRVDGRRHGSMGHRQGIGLRWIQRVLIVMGGLIFSGLPGPWPLSYHCCAQSTLVDRYPRNHFRPTGVYDRIGHYRPYPTSRVEIAHAISVDPVRLVRMPAEH